MAASASIKVESTATVLPFSSFFSLAIDALVQTAGGRLPVETALAIVDAIGEGLEFVHEAGVVHRDIKPGNILIDDNGRVYLIDFGIARIRSHPTLTQGSGMIGTPDYTSPEQEHSPTTVDGRADLFALAKVLLYMLCGSPEGPSRHFVAPIPKHVMRACRKATMPNPQARFTSVAEFLAALKAQHSSSGPGRSSWSCPGCHALIPTNQRFCSACGSSAQAAPAARCLACRTECDHGPVCTGCGRTFSSSNHALVFSSGTEPGTTFRIPEGSYDVGREQLGPRDSRISRRHLQVVCLNGSVAIQDLDSTNKTYVAGTLADHSIRLVPGAQLIVAGNVACYSLL